MNEHFARPFRNLDPDHLRDLETLEAEGAIYTYLWSEDDDRFVYVRIRLTPSELVAYVDALSALDQFLGFLSETGNPEMALTAIPDAAARARVVEYNSWSVSEGQADTQYCPAAFLGPQIEELVCSIVPGRHEILGVSYTADRRFLLREVLELLPSARAAAGEHGGYSFPLENEAHVRTLIFLVLKCIFPDARLEDPSPKDAGSSRRIDIVLPSLSVALEVKFVRNAPHARTVAAELKVDIESYHAHPSCKTLVAFVWDPLHRLPDRQNFIADLEGPRTKAGKTFSVEIVVKP